MSRAGIDWNDAFDNSGYVNGSDALPAQWAARAVLTSEGRAKLDQKYGNALRKTYDMFEPRTAPKGTVIFVRGGFWHMLDKSYWSHFASGCLDRGWRVVMLGYPLAPQVRIVQITAALVQMLTHMDDITTGPTRLVGHSAGGHLVTRMMCEGVLPQHIAERVARVVSVNGVHHLAPLLETEMNTTLCLDQAEADAESPVQLRAVDNIPVTFFVGDQERPEFLRQTRMAAELWSAQAVNVHTVYDTNTHHFNVIDSLQIPTGALTREVLR